jgi:transcriptional regulator with XRE-family HTH domain
MPPLSGCGILAAHMASGTSRLSPGLIAVRERRLAVGLSQTGLARAGMTQPALSRLEAGGVVPTIPLLDWISTALDADLRVEIAPTLHEPEGGACTLWFPVFNFADNRRLHTRISISRLYVADVGGARRLEWRGGRFR